MSKFYVIVILAIVCCQVNSQSTKAPCDERVPDSPTCDQYPDACTLPVKIKMCQRHCGLCSSSSQSTPGTTVVPVAVSSAGCIDTEPATLCEAYKSKGMCGVSKAQNLCCKTCNASVSPSAAPATSQPSTVPVTTMSTSKDNATTIPPVTTKIPTTTRSTTKPSAPTGTPKKPDPVTTPSGKSTKTATKPDPTTSPTTKPSVTSAKVTTEMAVTDNTSATSNNNTTDQGNDARISTTPAPTTTTNELTSSKTSRTSAIEVIKVGGDSLQIKVVTSGYLYRGTLDKIKSEVEELLKRKYPLITGVEEVDVQDGKTDSGEKVTIQTLRAQVPSTQDADNIKNEINGISDTFKQDLHDRLSKQQIELYDGEYQIAAESPPAKVDEISWAKSNWYVIFAIGLAALIIVGIIILALTTANRRKRQKLRLQENGAEKLAFTSNV